jgi:transaldolase
VQQIRLHIYCDTADLASMLGMDKHPLVQGFTTNPSLMRKAGIINYEGFGRMVLQAIKHKPVSFEVIAETAEEIERQAYAISAWGANAFVKITLTDQQGDSLLPVIQRLSQAGIPLNVTALFTLQQIQSVIPALSPDRPAILSIFAGRIADTGRDPAPLMRTARVLLQQHPAVKLLWASTREVFNVMQAQEAGCDIITLSPELIVKLGFFGKDLDHFARETVAEFYRDAMACSTGPRSDLQGAGIGTPTQRDGGREQLLHGMR